MPPALQFLVLTFAGWVNRHQDDLIAYLREENRVLREHLGPRPLRRTDAQRRRRAVRGQQLGRRVLMQVAGIVTPDTILRWYRRLIAQTYDGPMWDKHLSRVSCGAVEPLPGTLPDTLCIFVFTINSEGEAMDHAGLKDTVLKLKERIIRTEAGNMQLSETDTRQGLINPLFRALQWDFSDFESIKSELRVPQFNEPADYAFYSSKQKTDTPILLLEAKRLGSDLV